MNRFGDFGVTRRSVLLGLGAAAITPATTMAREPGWPATEALLAGYVAARKVAGASVAIQRRRSPPRFMNFGAQALDGPPANERTIWRTFSMSKPITGVAAMLLVEDGKLRLDQPVADILPAFANLQVLENGVTRPARTQMRISHLLTHTAGLGYAINAGTPLARLYIDAGLRPGDPTPVRAGEPSHPASLEEFGERLARLPLQADPGTVHSYSISIDLLGLVIQRASGKPFETFLKERLFDPVGMPDTAFYVAADKRARLAMNYGVSPEGIRALEPADASPYNTPPEAPSGGGGLVSTAADYIRFNRMLQNGGVIDGRRVMRAETARMTHANLLPPGVDADKGSAFGAGVGIATAKSAAVGVEAAGSYWWAGAAGTIMWNDPANLLSVVMMTQYMPSRAYPLWEELRRAVYRDLVAAR
jgi:CubicO group peptidase (beta-lactamase class C family)